MRTGIRSVPCVSLKKDRGGQSPAFQSHPHAVAETNTRYRILANRTTASSLYLASHVGHTSIRQGSNKRVVEHDKQDMHSSSYLTMELVASFYFFPLSQEPALWRLRKDPVDTGCYKS